MTAQAVDEFRGGKLQTQRQQEHDPDGRAGLDKVADGGCSAAPQSDR